MLIILYHTNFPATLNSYTVNELNKYKLYNLVTDLLNAKMYVNITDKEIDNLFKDSVVSMYYLGELNLEKASFTKVSTEPITKALLIFKGNLTLKEMEDATNLFKDCNKEAEVIIGSVESDKKEVLIIGLSKAIEKEKDPLLYDVAKHIIETNKASINDISRTFYIGYSRAVDILNELEKLGIIHTETTISTQIDAKLEDIDKIYNK